VTDQAEPTVVLAPPTPLVPGPASVDGIDVDRSNNNLDLCWHDGDLVLAWRTAPTHFASAHARLHVVRSTDRGRTWHHELTIRAGRDVREPRLVPWRGELHLYHLVLGRDPRRFEPGRAQRTVRSASGRWGATEAVTPVDCVPWRVRPFGDHLLMSLYRGAGTLYTRDPQPLHVELWTSSDGREWEPLDPDHPVTHAGGAEAEVLPLADGRLLAVVRKEGPAGGWGADIAIGSASLPGRWTMRSDPRKPDSPFLFLDRCERPWLLARRQVMFDGHFDLGVGTEAGRRTRINQLAWWLTPKRTALWRVDPDALSLLHVTDLPSAGDTSFAAAVQDPDGGHLIANYTSPPRHPRRPWVLGQLMPTAITLQHVYLGDASP